MPYFGNRMSEEELKEAKKETKQQEPVLCRNELQLEEVLSFYPADYDREMAKYWTEPDVKVGMQA